MEGTAEITPTESVETVAPASPATQDAPVSTPPVSDRPKSAKEAFELVERRQTEAAAQKDTATTPPATAVKPAGQPTAPIPADVHQKALDNARTKAVAEYREKHGWAESIPQQTFQQVANWVQMSQTDPLGYAERLVAEIEAHPVYGPQWKAKHASTNGNGNGKQGPAGIALDPDVEIIGPDGRPAGATFSADRVKAIVAHAVQEAIGREVQPLKTDYERRQEAEKQQRIEAHTAQQKAQATKAADAEWDDVKQLLEVEKDDDPLIADVWATWQAHPEWTSYRAALEVRKTKVTPKQSASAVQQATAEFQRKAAGSTVNGSGASALPTRLKTKADIAAFLAANAKRLESQ